VDVCFGPDATATQHTARPHEAEVAAQLRAIEGDRCENVYLVVLVYGGEVAVVNGILSDLLGMGAQLEEVVMPIRPTVHCDVGHLPPRAFTGGVVPDHDQPMQLANEPGAQPGAWWWLAVVGRRGASAFGGEAETVERAAELLSAHGAAVCKRGPEVGAVGVDRGERARFGSKEHQLIAGEHARHYRPSSDLPGKPDAVPPVGHGQGAVRHVSAAVHPACVSQLGRSWGTVGMPSRSRPEPRSGGAAGR